MKFDVLSHLILKARMGSHAYGTAVDDSDEDYRGIIIAPKSYYLGLDRFDQYESNNPDVVYYDIQKYTDLALKANPNILEILFAPEYDIRTEYGLKLISLRNLFLTKHCAKTYIGYAEAQLRKMKTKPAPGTRTERRMALIEKYGFDCKFGMHLIRLLSTCKEILTEGQLRVRRPDANFLLDIRNGKYTRDQIEKMAEELLIEVREAEKVSQLSARPNYNVINQAVVEIIEEFISQTKE